jgi:superfamily II DNA/RNA helicase
MLACGCGPATRYHLSLQHFPSELMGLCMGRSELRRLENGRCDVLVATPGRLIDHLQNSGLVRRHTMFKLRGLLAGASWAVSVM